MFIIVKMNKKIIWIAIIAILAVLLALFFFFYPRYFNKKMTCPPDTKVCPDGTIISRLPPTCEFALCPGEKEGILVFNPKINQKIKSPLAIEGQARGFWFFEGQFSVELYDQTNQLLGRAILAAQKDWASENYVPFKGELNFSPPTTAIGFLRFLSDNPSGLKENQKIFEMPVQFEIQTREVLLYYYNPQKDRDSAGNIQCSRAGLVAIKRNIPLTQTPIEDTLNLLLKGKENLTKEEEASGLTTEFPLAGLKLESVNLKPDGTLILEFSDPLAKTIGGSCRVGILWFQIEATAKQFPEVKQVKFLPEELFQP